MKKIYYLFVLISTFSLAQTKTQVETFLPDLFSQFPNVRDLSISNDQTELYFTVEGFKKEFSFIAFSKKENGTWLKPTVASFSGMDKDLEPFLSPDNLKLYFASNRNTEEGQEKKDMDIWFVERSSTKTEWSEPKNIGAPINTGKDEFYPSVAVNGNLYFTASIESDTKGKEDIYKSELINGVYQKPVSLSKNINSETYEFNAYISPDESIIIYSSYRRPDSFGGTDLYISIKDENGLWKPAKNLGVEINSDKIDYCPFVDFNSNTFYFTSERSHQNKSYPEQMSMDEILSEMKKSPNGQSRIFFMTFDVALFK
ncbi:MAG: hypothetical protein PSN34_04500 [Urechidicola sp.]|nr:hypothetical protein [Urechidicola sp.]